MLFHDSLGLVSIVIDGKRTHVLDHDRLKANAKLHLSYAFQPGFFTALAELYLKERG